MRHPLGFRLLHQAEVKLDSFLIDLQVEMRQAGGLLFEAHIDERILLAHIHHLCLEEIHLLAETRNRHLVGLSDPQLLRDHLPIPP